MRRRADFSAECWQMSASWAAECRKPCALRMSMAEALGERGRASGAERISARAAVRAAARPAAAPAFPPPARDAGSLNDTNEKYIPVLF